MVLLSVVVLGLSYATTYVLVRRELQENALANLRSRTTELQPAVARLAASTAGDTTGLLPRLRGLRADLRAGLRLTDLNAVLVGPDGTVTSAGANAVFALPAGIAAGDLDTTQLLAGNDVSGRHGDTVFLAIPARQIGRQQLVVIATDKVETKVLSSATPLLLLAGTRRAPLRGRDRDLARRGA